MLMNITAINIYATKNLLNILLSIANAIPMELIAFQESMLYIVLWTGFSAQMNINQLQMLMCGKVTHKNLIDNRPLFRYYSSIWIEKTSLIQYNKVSGRYLYEGKNTNH